MYFRNTGAVIFYMIIIKPISLIISFHFTFTAPIIVSRQKRLIMVTIPFKSFQFTRHIDLTIFVISYIKRYNTYRVTRNQKFIFFSIIQSECKDTAKVFKEVNTFLTIQGKNNFTVTTCLIIIFSCKAFSYLLMIINLTINRQNLFLVRTEQGLFS